MVDSGPTQFLVEPAIPRCGELFFKPQTVVFCEIGIDSTLQRMEPQEVRGKTVEGADLGFFEIVKAGLGTRGDVVGAQPIARARKSSCETAPPPIDRMASACG